MRNVFLRRATEEDTHKPDRGSPPSTPRWVKVLVVIALVLVLLLVILRLTGIIDHGPGSHMRSDGGHTPPSSVIASVIAHGGQQL